MSTGLMGDEIRRVWGAQLGRAATQPYLMAVFVGSLSLSVASFYTTFVGMNSFAPNLFVNFCIVFAIQALLFVTSWRIGFSLADREPLPLFTVFVFVICLATSVFFSWVALFETINTEADQKLSRETRMQRAVEDANTSLFGRVAAHQRRLVDTMVTSDAYAAWRDNVRTIGDVALSASAVLEAERDAAAAAAIDQIQRLEAQKAELLRTTAGRSERALAAERDLARLNEIRPELVERAARLRQEVSAATEAAELKRGQMEAEERGGAAGQGTGRGPIWRALRDEFEIVKADRDTKLRLLDAVTTDLTAADQRIQELTARVAADRNASAEAELATIDRRLAEIQARQDLQGGPDGGSLAGDVERINAELDSFQSRFDLAALDRATALCATMLDSLRGAASLADRVATLSCDRVALTDYQKPIEEGALAATALAARCAPNGAEALKIGALGFAEAEEYGRECIALAGLPRDQVDDLRDEIDRLVIEEDPNARAYIKTLNAFAYGDKLSYLSLAIALFIDMLVLFSGLIGALSGTGALRRALGWNAPQKQLDDFKNALAVFDNPKQTAKALLALIEPYHGPWRVEGARTVGLIDLSEYDGDEADLLRGFLTERPKMAVAEPVGGKPGWFGGARAASTERRRDRFIVSDLLTRALRAVAAGGEEVEQIGGDLGVAGHLDRADRRRAARAILRAVQPFTADDKTPRALRIYDSQVALDAIKPATAEQSAHGLREAAKEILFGLYQKGLARGYSPNTGHGDARALPRYYVTKRGRDRLEALGAGVSAGPAYDDDGMDVNSGLPASYRAIAASGPKRDASIESVILGRLEPVTGLADQIRHGALGARAVAYVDLSDIPEADQDEARRRLNALHFDRMAKRVDIAPPSGSSPAYLLRPGAITWLQNAARDEEAERAAARSRAPAPTAIPAPAPQPRLSYEPDDSNGGGGGDDRTATPRPRTPIAPRPGVPRPAPQPQAGPQADAEWDSGDRAARSDDEAFREGYRKAIGDLRRTGKRANGA